MNVSFFTWFSYQGNMLKPPRKLWILFLLISLSVVLLMTAGVSWLKHRTLPTLSSRLGGDFTLMGRDGLWNLKSQRGRPVILYFGFTQCPDICPTALHTLSQILKSIEIEKERNHYTVVFVSIDPEQDSPSKAQEYLEAFLTSTPTRHLYGLTGTIEELREVSKQYGAHFLREKSERTSIGYTMQHTSRFFLIDERGTLVAAPSTEGPREKLVESFRKIF
jgi:protein SCO1/2